MISTSLQEQYTRAYDTVHLGTGLEADILSDSDVRQDRDYSEGAIWWRSIVADPSSLPGIMFSRGSKIPVHE